ncbi:MAG TPA: hypothetical protein VF017_16515 [Thermoanaerobaculia bacterium]|nr:hypothetical protein [Thermoanaerobaculia bacterium]
MTLRTSEITLPNVRLRLEDLLTAIHDLDEPSRTRVAQALAEAEMDARFRTLIDQLAARVTVEDLSDSDITREVQAVRAARRSA